MMLEESHKAKVEVDARGMKLSNHYYKKEVYLTTQFTMGF